MTTTLQPVIGYGMGGYGLGGYGGYQALPVPSDNPALPIDHLALGLSRVITQYSESPKFLAYLSAMLSMANDVEATLQSLYSLPDIDSMEGVNLDVIGQIVGVTREIPDSVQLTFFGFAGYSYETVFGELGQLGIGSRFYELGETYTGTSTLGDIEYRLLLRAKIMKNASHSTCEDILGALAFLFSLSAANVDDYGGMVIGLAIGRQLTVIEQAILAQLDLLPRPATVLIGSITTYDSLNYFGFSDQPGALTFGAGVFAELIQPPSSADNRLVARGELVEAIAA